MELAAVVSSYGAAWNEPDDAARRALLEQAWADDAVYQDPTAVVEGREALLEHIAGFAAQFPGHTIVNTSGVDGHHGWFRFSWSLKDATGAAVVDGFDVGELADDGRIGRIVGFFGPFPPAPA